MADKKISALTGATTPLAGTEVLPIVQSGATVKVSVANLTSGRAINASQAVINSTTSPVANFEVWGAAAVAGSQATYVGSVQLNENPTSLSQVGGIEWKAADFGAGYGWKAVTVDSSGVNLIIANRQNSATWTEFARFAQNGNFSVANGNVVIGTSGKGIDFSATSGSGTSELLADYEEGTWTPAAGANLSIVGTPTYTGQYTKVGNTVTAWGSVSATTSVSYTAGGQIFSGLPYAAQGIIAVGTVINNAFTFSSSIATLPTTAFLYGAEAMGATTAIYFQVTYHV